MFDEKSNKERIGYLKKSASLSHLKEAEAYLFTALRKLRTNVEISYDVIANEIPYFKTFNYTEWAHSLIVHPLQQELRMRQMQDAYDDNAEVKIDYVEYFKNRVLSGHSNKYQHIESNIGDTTKPYKKYLVVLVGSNKLKDRICLNKLKWIKKQYDDQVLFKPHPITTHQVVGELKDLFGSATILDRDEDMYAYLVNAEVVFTSHMSESATYAVCLGKQIEPIDIYNKVEQGSFYHINKFLFTAEDPKYWLNRTLNSPKCGIVNPEIDPNWKEKIDQYLYYILKVRESYRNKYIVTK